MRLNKTRSRILPPPTPTLQFLPIQPVLGLQPQNHLGLNPLLERGPSCSRHALFMAFWMTYEIRWVGCMNIYGRLLLFLCLVLFFASCFQKAYLCCHFWWTS